MLQAGWLKQRLFAPYLDDLRGPRGLGVQLGRVLYLAVQEFRSDFCLERAASLTFATIISLFPLSVLFVTVAGSLAGGEDITSFVREKLVGYLGSEFKEPLEGVLRDSAEGRFTSWPTGLVNMIAGLVLLLSALGVLVTAERVFHRIWKVPSRRSYFQKLTTFWVLLTTSPLMILVSISMGNYLTPTDGSIRDFLSQPFVAELIYGWLVPIGVGFLAFTLVYLFLPSTRVRIHSAAAGAIVAAVLWEASKRGFTSYVSFTGRETHFLRDIAAIPLFLLWLYLSWAITLWGGEISYVFQNLRVLSMDARRQSGERRFSLAFLGVYLLSRIGDTFQRGKPAPSLGTVAGELGLDDGALTEVAAVLTDRGLLVEGAQSRGKFTLAQHPGRVALGELVKSLGESEFSGEVSVFVNHDPLEGTGAAVPSVSRQLNELFERARAGASRAFGDLTLEELTTNEADRQTPSRSADVPGAGAAVDSTR